MTIDKVCRRFVEGKKISGAYMGVEDFGERTNLSYRYGGTNRELIAEIVDRKENGDFTLILHPRSTSWGKTTHNNRIHGVLLAIAGDYRNIRYTSYVQHYIKIHDRKLSASYQLERPMKFNSVGGKLVLDYKDMERQAEPAEERVVVPEPSDNSNIKNELDRLSLILATV